MCTERDGGECVVYAYMYIVAVAGAREKEDFDTQMGGYIPPAEEYRTRLQLAEGVVTLIALLARRVHTYMYLRV